jgi:hypothetical protein
MFRWPLETRLRTAISLRTWAIRVDDEERDWKKTHHMLAALHQALVDDLACIVFPRLDVDRLFDDGIGTASEGSSSPILVKDIQAVLTQIEMDEPGRAP